MGTPPGLLTHEILSKNDSICEHALGRLAAAYYEESWYCIATEY
jgi:hypothetical protein